jgi:hypothetical protein
MATPNKITIRVLPGRRAETISWQGSGTFGSLILAQSVGQLNNEPLTSAATPNLYFNGILTLVLPHLV